MRVRPSNSTIESKMKKTRRNRKQELLMTRIEQVENVIKETMLNGGTDQLEREATLSKLFQERDQAKKELRTLQLTQARGRRFRARKDSGASGEQIQDGWDGNSSPSPISTLMDQEMTVEDLKPFILLSEFEFLEDLERNFKRRSIATTLAIIRFRKEHLKVGTVSSTSSHSFSVKLEQQ
jgi:hypothetical protein